MKRSLLQSSTSSRAGNYLPIDYMPKYVALQLIGLIRGFRFEQVRRNIYSRLIEPLEEKGWKVHIFWHTYDQEYDKAAHDLSERDVRIKAFRCDKAGITQKALENEHSISTKYTFPSTWAHTAGRCGDCDRKEVGHLRPGEYHLYGWFHYLNSLRAAVELRNKHENAEKIKYQWVITSSPQMEPQNIIDDLRSLNNRYMYSPGYSRFGGYYDSFWISNTRDADYMGNFYEYMVTEKIKQDPHLNYPHRRDYIDAEPLFKAYIDKACIMKDILKIRFNRVRYNGHRVDH